MATIDRIQHKRSSDKGRVEQASNMLEGELFINLYDAKLYIKNSSGSMVCIGKVLDNVSGAATYLKAGDYTSKGMLLVGTGSSGFTGLAAGSSGQVLTVAPAETCGLKWVTP